MSGWSASGKAEAQRMGLHRVGHGLPGVGAYRPRQVVGARLVWRFRICANSGSFATAASGTRRIRATGRWSSRSGAEGAFGEQRDLGALAALARRHVQQLDEGAVAHHDLARVRVGLGQQALQVAAQQDLPRHAQVHHPGLQVVRMRRQDRVAQDPAAQVGLVARALPGRHGLGRHGHRAAAGYCGCSEDHPAACDADETTTVHAANSLSL
jgi:hypothetical protein